MVSPQQSANLARSWRQQRFNPLRTITPQLAGTALDQWDAGYLRAAAMMWEEIEARDGKCVVVCEKRRSKVTRCEWDVLIGEEVEDKDLAEAERQQQVLKQFYSRLRTFSSVDLDVEGGVKLLIERTMDARLCQYSAFETVWSGGMRRGRGELKCDLWHVPNYFLEKTTGKLRFAGVNGGPNGQAMPRENWMVAVGRPLMKAVTVSYIFKRLSLADWLNFSEKFGIPGVHKETMAKPGSPEWEQGLDSLAGFANDWMIQTTAGEKINLIQAGMSGDGPFAPMVERMDREITSIIMGADLATMSRADGAGASLQGDETDDLIDGDCEWVSEVFQRRLDARVLEWHFGVGVEPLAFFKLSPPANVDTTIEMKVDEHVTKLGVKLSVADVAERYGRTHDETAEETQLDKTQDSRDEAEQASTLPRAEDGEEDEEDEDEAAGANVFNPMQARDLRGQWTEGGGGGLDGARGTGRPKKAIERESIKDVVQAALADPDARDYALYAEISEEESHQINERTSNPVSLVGYKRMLGAGEVNKVIKKHSKDRRPVVPADFESLPEKLGAPHSQWWEQRNGKPDVLISLIKEESGAMRIIEEQRVGRGQLTLISMYRP